MAQRETKRPYDLALLSDTGEYHHQLQTTGTNSTSVPEHPPTGTLDDGHPKQHRPCTDNTNTFLTSTFKAKCFRISNIPSDWTKQKLLNVIHNLDPSSGSSEIFENWLDLFHSGCGNQIALLNVKSRVPFFDGIISNETKFIPEHNIEIDCHFYGMTPLHTPRDASADIIAVTGLAGHPYGSWKNKECGFMWLKDFLPADFKDVRILTYGYNTNLTKDTSESFLLDYSYGLIQALENIRRSTETTRPIIFIGHSMGGLLIGQTLLHANMQPRYKHIFEATRAIIFFATPHRGMEVDDIQLMIKNMPNHAVSREMLVEQLKKDSDFLYRYNDELRKLWAIRPEISVTSFYETLKTPSVQRISDSWTRNGKAVEMVNPTDASLFLPHELRVPVNADHSNIVKFRTRQDEAYKTVVGHITDYLEQSNTGIAMSSAIYDQSKFCGRRDILDELQKVLGSDDTQVSVLHGLGGVGKTSIARQFGSGLPKKGWAVLWIPSSSKTKIDTEFENTARKLSSKDTITNPVSYVTTWLLKNYAKRWLMIFDELDDTRIEISQYIPSSQPLGKYLITTRDSRVANHIGLSLKIEIKPLDKESSLVLLRSIVFDLQENILLSEEQAQRKVVQELGHLPLAITIVGAYLKDRYDGSCIR